MAYSLDFLREITGKHGIRKQKGFRKMIDANREVHFAHS